MPRHLWRSVRLVSFVALASCATSPSQAPVAVAPQGTATDALLRSALHDYRLVTVADSLRNPWSMAFLPGGDMLVTERAGRLRIIRNGKLLPGAVPGLPRIRVAGQGGLLDVLPHPAYAANRLVYFSYAKPNADSTQSTTAVARARFENDRLTNVEEIFEGELWLPGRGHYGSRLAFDRNGFLFITLGDRQVEPQGNLETHPAQDRSNHMGDIVRLHDDGRVPADNPFVGRDSVLPEIWSYGHRNVQGFVVHPETGDLWATEHGPQGGDELNLIQAGKNYGWPVIGFGVNYRTGSAIHGGTQREGMEQPVHVWVPSIGTSGLLLYTGNTFPRWRGNMFAGGMVGQQLVRLTMDGRRVTNVETLVQGKGRIRDVKQGPDGFIYLAIDHPRETTPIVRLEPVPER